MRMVPSPPSPQKSERSVTVVLFVHIFLLCYFLQKKKGVLPTKAIPVMVKPWCILSCILYQNLFCF